MGEIPSRAINGSEYKGLTFKLMARWKSLQVYSQVIKKLVDPSRENNFTNFTQKLHRN
jgi:hypothetical protein